MNKHYLRESDYLTTDTRSSVRPMIVAALILAIVLAFVTQRADAAVDRVTVSVYRLIDLANGRVVAQSFTSCDDAVRAQNPTKVSGSARLRCYRDFTVYYKAGTPPPPTCPALPAPRQQTCPTGTVGSWTQTPTMAAPPACTVVWSPSSAPAGACSTPSTETWTTACAENTTCTLPSAPRSVRYGCAAGDGGCPAGGLWNTPRVINATTFRCDNETFGDTAPYVAKKCQYSNVIPVVEPPPPVPTGSALLRWVAPTQNQDGSALTDLAGFNIYYGNSATALTQSRQVANPQTLTYVLGGFPLSSSPRYFAVRAYKTDGTESPNSNLALKVIQ